jgi:hypothetical protein
MYEGLRIESHARRTEDRDDVAPIAPGIYVMDTFAHSAREAIVSGPHVSIALAEQDRIGRNIAGDCAVMRFDGCRWSRVEVPATVAPTPSPALAAGEGDRSLHHEPEWFACNMGWVVRDGSGEEIYRGPEWRARMILRGMH